MRVLQGNTRGAAASANGWYSSQLESIGSESSPATGYEYRTGTGGKRPPRAAEWLQTTRWHDDIFMASQMCERSGRRIASESGYGEFYDEHIAFLQRYPSADARQRKRWLRFIEREGLECALWPHMFQERQQFLTWTRLQSTTRQARAEHKSTLESRFDAVDEGDRNQEEAPPDLAGVRRVYMSLVLSKKLAMPCRPNCCILRTIWCFGLIWGASATWTSASPCAF